MQSYEPHVCTVLTWFYKRRTIYFFKGKLWLVWRPSRLPLPNFLRDGGQNQEREAKETGSKPYSNINPATNILQNRFFDFLCFWSSFCIFFTCRKNAANLRGHFMEYCGAFEVGKKDKKRCRKKCRKKAAISHNVLYLRRATRMRKKKETNKKCALYVGGRKGAFFFF